MLAVFYLWERLLITDLLLQDLRADIPKPQQAMSSQALAGICSQDTFSRFLHALPAAATMQQVLFGMKQVDAVCRLLSWICQLHSPWREVLPRWMGLSMGEGGDFLTLCSNTEVSRLRLQVHLGAPFCPQASPQTIWG